MQRATRSNTDNTLVHVEDPEQIIRVRRRSMAEQAEQGVVNRNLRVTRDSDGEEYSEAEEMNIRDLYVPDLNNTPLQRAIQNGMALNDTQTIYRIRPTAQRRGRTGTSVLCVRKHLIKLNSYCLTPKYTRRTNTSVMSATGVST